jgi:hypothetical protein
MDQFREAFVTAFALVLGISLALIIAGTILAIIFHYFGVPQ